MTVSELCRVNEYPTCVPIVLRANFTTYSFRESLPDLCNTDTRNRESFPRNLCSA